MRPRGLISALSMNASRFGEIRQGRREIFLLGIYRLVELLRVL